LVSVVSWVSWIVNCRVLEVVGLVGIIPNLAVSGMSEVQFRDRHEVSRVSKSETTRFGFPTIGRLVKATVESNFVLEYFHRP